MISIDDGHPPPDPSSSHHHHLKINSDDDNNCKPSASVSDDLDLKSPDADLDDTNNHHPLPSFSIRDHVFGLRSKDVARNWPFSSKSLQLCLKNGVKNVLPPFQPLDLLRNNISSITKCNLETPLTPIEEPATRFNGTPTEDRPKPAISKAPKPTRNQPALTINSSGSKENQESNTRSKEKPPTYNSSSKKSKSVLKLNSGFEPVDQSETMASKVCPVCKIFSSSSNTTLNAHIDQCLTGEASMKWTDNSKVIVKHRIKPRKTRLMLDIYKTAPHCTIEELDRRNGTSWATNSSFPAQEIQFQEEKNEPRLTAMINPEVKDNEGDVYIDTDGTKVRILSVPKVGKSDNDGDGKLLKGVKGCRIVIGKKKHNLFKARHHQKYLKLGSKTGKLSSPKPLNAHRGASEIRSEHEKGVSMAESCRKEEKASDSMAGLVSLAIVRPPWACSKRTRLGKKLRRHIGVQKHPTKDLLSETDKYSSEGSDFTTPTSSYKIDSSQIQKKTRTLSPLLSNKFSSLNKNLSFSASKISLKRKFSGFEKSVSDSDSSKDQSPMEEEEEEEEETDSMEDALLLPPDVNATCQETIGDGGLMELSNSFKPGFSGQPDPDQICSPDGKNIFGNDIELDGREDVEKNQDYFDPVDPIPIPGPPGSFLPSPGGDTVSEEIQPMAIRVPPTENPHNLETVDRDSMSNSPVSTVSNPSMARSDSRSSEKLSYRCGSVQEDQKPGFSSVVIEPIFKKSLMNDWRPPVDHFEKGAFPANLIKKDQPCCCSRKEYSVVASSYQDSFSLRKQQPIESVFSLNNYPISQPPDAAKKPPTCDSKPVLRLMGKNLTVVKTDHEEDVNQQVVRNDQKVDHFNGYPCGPMIFNHFDRQPPPNMRSFMAADHGGPMVTPARSNYGYNGVNYQRNMYNSAISSSNPVKEIIVIDDSSPENEESFRRNANQFYSMYQPPYGGGGPAVFRGGGYQTSFGFQMGSSSSSSSSSTPSNSMSHLRSSIAYYPPCYP